MQKFTKPVRVDAQAHDRAREAGLCVSKIATKALIQAADALEGTTTKTKETGAELPTATAPATTPKEGNNGVICET
ncbi:MAG: hypothetical protein ABSG28_03825 [Methanoregula sp.]|jgi:post-segregation antitoxin (ccd killing protein)|uniref:hypothetical protein n=1 Tax=Methanoregula sp. TaxID=2052170 RepID=UPI003C254286